MKFRVLSAVSSLPQPTSYNRALCFICMQVTDTTSVTCFLHVYWPPVLNRIGTNKSLSWHCRLPHCFFHASGKVTHLNPLEPRRGPIHYASFVSDFSARFPLFFTPPSVKHNIITESHTLTWHPQQLYSPLRCIILEQGATEMQKTDNNLLWQDPYFYHKLASSWFYVAPRSFCFASIQ